MSKEDIEKVVFQIESNCGYVEDDSMNYTIANESNKQLITALIEKEVAKARREVLEEILMDYTSSGTGEDYHNLISSIKKELEDLTKE